MRTSNYLLLVILLLLSYATPFSAQISTVRPDKACIGCKTGEPHASAALDVVSGNKGILIPRVQSTASITNPALGLLIFDQSTDSFKYYNGTTWVEFGGDEEVVSLGINNSIADVPQAVAMGLNNSISSDRNTAVGINNTIEQGVLGCAAFGYFNVIDGAESSAFGIANDILIGRNNVAFGNNNEASGLDFCSAIGYGNKSNSAGRSNAIGYINEATGISSNAIGSENIATSNRGSAFGNYNEVSGIRSSAFGSDNNITADYTNAFGYDLIADVYGLTAVGIMNLDPFGSSTSWGSKDPVFVVGNGQPTLSRSTALTILKNGNTGIGITNPSYRLQLDINSAAKPLSSTWTIASDKRLKTSIRKFEDGLAILEKIRPVYFKYNDKSGLPTDEEGIGIIAQEIQEIAPYMVNPYTVIQKDGSEETYLSYDANALFYILVNAVQEQQEEIEELEAQVKELKELKDRLSNVEALLAQQEQSSTLISSARLEQNIPNPFNSETVIGYTLPENVQQASIQISDQNGQVLKSIPIKGTGKGQISLQANALNAGTYFYSLIINGQVVQSKKMLLTK